MILKSSDISKAISQRISLLVPRKLKHHTLAMDNHPKILSGDLIPFQSYQEL
jgi:hypothetical protein